MSSFSGPEFARASRILEALRRGNLLEVPLPNPGEVVGVFEEPAHLLHSLQHFHPNSVGLFVVDPPRASKRENAQLWDIDDEGLFNLREVSRDDPDYRYHLAATVLAAVRLMVNALHREGWILAFATTETYMMVRGALEQYLGFDRFRGELVYQTKTGGSNDSKYIVNEHEMILAFSVSETPRNLRIAKGEGELARYDEADDNGRYTWDTFPRRSARNYYPIRCPDGSILEFDSDGNRESWLWSESTYREKLAEGELRFQQLNGAWKIYYKDRLTDRKSQKVVRSLTLHGSPLGEILGTRDDSSGSGRDLQTQTGTQEIRGFTGDKPDYVKPSRLYSFLIEAFDQGVTPTVIPFADRGSAALTGYLDRLDRGLSMNGLLVNGRRGGEELWNWRLGQAPQAVQGAATIASPLGAVPFEELILGDLDPAQIASMVSLTSGSWELWNNLQLAGVHGLWRAVGDEVQLVLDGPPAGISETTWEETGHLIQSDNAPVRVWGTANDELMAPVMRRLARTSSYHQVPTCFLP